MNLNLEALPVVLAFVLPGFLTSRLVAARTPVVSREASPFTEFFESLLRSIYIQLVVIPIALWLITQKALSAQDFGQIVKDGIVAYAATQPFQVLSWFIWWIAGSLLLAAALGLWWEPLDWLTRKLSRRIGFDVTDPWYSVRETALRGRSQGRPIQLWIQARLKNGYTYQGEFAYAGFQRESEGRELLLRNVRFYPYPAQVEERPDTRPSHYEAVLLNTAECHSIEVVFQE